MTTTRSPLYERDLALPVKDYLQAEGWELFEEVPFLGKIPDIVCRWDNPGGGQRLLATVELKTSLCLKVIAQALHHLDHAHDSWIAVPAGKDTPERALALGLCLDKGIGVFEVRELEKLEEERGARGEAITRPRVTVVIQARRHRVADEGLGLWRACAPEHQTHAPAGSKGGVRWNATQKLHAAVRAYVVENGGVVTLDEVVPAIGGSTSVVRAHLAAGKIAQVRLNWMAPTVMLETVLPGDEEPIYSARSLRTRARR